MWGRFVISGLWSLVAGYAIFAHVQPLGCPEVLWLLSKPYWACFTLLGWSEGRQDVPTSPGIKSSQSRSANLPLQLHTSQMSAAGARRWARTLADQKFSSYQNSLPLHQRLRLSHAGSQPSTELRLPQKNLARLLAAQSGHGNFAAHHARFHHIEAKKRCRCGALTTPTHFYYCRHNRHKRLLTSKQRHRLTIREVLDTPEGAQAFSLWAEILGFFATSRRPN